MYVFLVKLSRNGVSGILTTVGIATALNYKVFDYTMKRRIIIPAFVYQLDEVVTMKRRVVVEFHDDVAHIGLYTDLSFFFLCLHCDTD